MIYQRKVSLTARTEIEDAASYYENASEGLGLAFLDQVEKKFHSICKNPFAYGFIDSKKTLRDVAIPRYPFVIIFWVDSTTVYILSVHHTSKQPEY